MIPYFHAHRYAPVRFLTLRIALAALLLVAPGCDSGDLEADDFEDVQEEL